MFTGMCGFHEKLAFHYFHGEFLFVSCCYIDDVNAAWQQIDVYVLLSLCQVYTLLQYTCAAMLLMVSMAVSVLFAVITIRLSE